MKNPKRPAALHAALRFVITSEMPTLLPKLRIKLNIAVPSLRYRGASVANAIVESGTKVTEAWEEDGDEAAVSGSGTSGSRRATCDRRRV